MREAVAVYAARAAEKLRAEGLKGRSFNRDRCNLDRRMGFHERVGTVLEWQAI
jgi:hypothetical protein